MKLIIALLLIVSALVAADNPSSPAQPKTPQVSQVLLDIARTQRDIIVNDTQADLAKKNVDAQHDSRDKALRTQYETFLAQGNAMCTAENKVLDENNVQCVEKPKPAPKPPASSKPPAAPALSSTSPTGAKQ